MATVYSLICFGGRTGKTVTMTIASPCVVTLTNHGLRAGTGVILSTTGALPTGVTAGTTYYANSTGANTFNLYDTEANAIAGGATGRVNTSGSQSGTHTIKSAYFLGLSSGQLARYGDSGSERIYDGLSAWNTARASASPLDSEVCEIGQAFDDIRTTALSITVPSGSSTITSLVNGTRSGAFHNGVHGAGYRLCSYVNAVGNILTLSKYNTVFEGLSVFSGAGYGTHGVSVTGGLSVVRNCVVTGSVTGTNSGTGIYLAAQNSRVEQNIVNGWQAGIGLNTYTYGVYVAGNIVTKNINAFSTSNATYTYGFYYNNIVIGNVTTNWPTWPNIEGASGNAGLSGTAFVTGSGYRVTIATSDFVSWGTSSVSSSDDYSPALTSSPQVEMGVEYYGVLYYDANDNIRPAYPGSNYNTAVTAGSFVSGLSYTIASVGTTDFTLIGASANTVGVTFKATGAGTGTGTATLNAKIDIGAYEFDLGYGAWPATFTLTIDNVVVGSSIQLEESDGTLIEFRTADSTSEVFAISASLGVITVKIRKGSSGAKYQPYETQTTAFDGAASIYVSQVADTIAA